MKGEGEHGSVSEQKTWSDGSRQPMGCGRSVAEWEVMGGRVAAVVAVAGEAAVCDGGWARAYWYFYPVTSC